MRATLLKAGSAADLKLVGLKPDRVPVLAGGLAIMLAAFAEFDIGTMSVSDGALRTGVLYDLLGRTSDEDKREATVRDLMRRYEVDETHAMAVAALARSLWQGLVDSRPASDSRLLDGAEAGDRILRWAAMTHEIGLTISHNGYHKHSAYILSNADLPGFSRREQAALAALVVGHTGKLPKVRALIEAEEDWRLVLCLRLAAVVYRSRNYGQLPAVTLTAGRRGYALGVPRSWLESNPLTEYDLREEMAEWRRLGKDVELDAV